MTVDNGAKPSGQGETPEDIAQPDPASADETPDSGHDDRDQDDVEDQDDDGNPNHESAKWRVKFRQAARERDEAQDTLRRQHQAIMDNAVSASGMDPRLMIAAGHTVDSLVGDDGLLDTARLAEAITTTAHEFNIRRPGKLEPNPQQGSHGPPPRQSSWANAFAPPRT